MKNLTDVLIHRTEQLVSPANYDTEIVVNVHHINFPLKSTCCNWKQNILMNRKCLCLKLQP